MGNIVKTLQLNCLALVAVSNITLASVTPDSSMNDINNAYLLKLTPEQLVKEVSRRNAATLYEQLQWRLAERQVDIEKAIFEPEFVASLMHQDIDTPNSVEESLSRSFQSQYEEESLRLSTGIKGKVFTGGEWSVTYNLNETQSSVIDQFAAFDTEYRNTLQLQYKQPLLRNRGRDITMSKRHLAEFAQEIAFLTYRLRLMETSGTAIQAYWNYYRAQELLAQWQESLEVSEKLYEDARARVRRGLGAQTDVLETETAVASNRARVINVGAELIEARNRIFSLLNITSEVNPDFKIVAVSRPEDTGIDVPTYSEGLEKALANWPPFLVAQEKVKSENVQVRYSKNQLKPRLDLALGVDMVGLDDERNEAFDGSVDGSASSWYVGLELNMPILSNRKAKGELAQSKLRERQAKLEMESVRRNLSNSLHSRIARVRNAEQELVYHRKDLELKRRLRDAEIEKVQRGRSDMREVFRQEEELKDYQRRYLRAVVELKLAEAALDIAQGDLLAKYDIDIQRDDDEAKIAYKTSIPAVSEPASVGPVETIDNSQENTVENEPENSEFLDSDPVETDPVENETMESETLEQTSVNPDQMSGPKSESNEATENTSTASGSDE